MKRYTRYTHKKNNEFSKSAGNVWRLFPILLLTLCLLSTAWVSAAAMASTGIPADETVVAQENAELQNVNTNGFDDAETAALKTEETESTDFKSVNSEDAAKALKAPAKAPILLAAIPPEYASAVARVSTNGGATWTYYDLLLTSGATTGAFTYAATQTGDVEIELLKETDPAYTLTAVTTFDKAANIALRTTQDPDWNPGGFTSVIMRGFNGVAAVTNSDTNPLFYLNNSSARLRFENITLDGARDTYVGRAVCVNYGDVCFMGGTTVQNFFHDGKGSALYVNRSGTHTIIDNSSDRDVIFKNCGVKQSSNNSDGACICIDYGNAVVNNSGSGTILFEGIAGNSSTDGGAIGVDGAGSLTVNNTSDGNIRFVDCTAQYGGALETDNGGITLNNTGTGTMEFVRCYVNYSQQGGAIYCGGKFSAVNNGTISFTGTIGTAAEAMTKTTNGGAIFVYSNASDACSITGSGQTGFANCKANTNGGAIYANGGVTIDQTGGTSFTNCAATGSGGGVYSGSGTATITNATFTGCSSNNTSTNSSNGGGGIYGKQLNVSHSTFTDCTAKAEGGAIHGNASSGVMHSIADCTFYGHRSLDGNTVNAQNGGAVRIWDGSLTMTGCKFYDLTCTNRGGTLDMGGGGGDTLDMDNCTIIGHDTLDPSVKNASIGGAIRINASAGVALKNVRVLNCRTSGNGGGLYVDSTSTPITSTEGMVGFTDCYTTGGSGGGAYFSGPATFGKAGTTGNTVTFTGCHDDSTSTSNGGGGAYFYNTVTVQDGTDLSFDACYAGSYGGGAYFYNTVTLQGGTDLSFDACYAGFCGGGAYFYAALTLNTDITFENCHTDTAGTSGGGGAYFNGALSLGAGNTLTFKECYTAAYGGGAHFRAAENAANIKGSLSFEQCYSEGGNGGGVYFYNTANLTEAAAVTFKGCHANSTSTSTGNGGGAYFNGAATLDEAAYFEDCYTDGNGGAMYFNYTSSGTINKITNVTVDGHKTLASGTANAAKGGAIFIANSKTLTVVGGEIKNCSASDEAGGAVNAGGTGAILNFEGAVHIFKNKSTKNGSEVLANVVLDYNDNDLIRTTANGLSSDAHIGVYVIDVQMDAHGGINDPFGTWTAADGKNNLGCFTNDRNIRLFGMYRGDSDRLIYWGAAICKIEDGNAEGGEKLEGRSVYEHPFPSLNAALNYARANLSGTATIEMLIDYEFPKFDVVTLNQPTDNITITTAATSGCVFTFDAAAGSIPGRVLGDDAVRAILLRSWDGATAKDQSLFYLNADSAKLVTRDIVFDGGQTVNTAFKGRAVYVDKGELTVTGGSMFRHFITADHGGAIYSEGMVTITGTAEKYVTFEDCHATAGSGGAVRCVNCDLDYVRFGKRGADGKAIEGNVSALISGGALFDSGTGNHHINHCEFLGCSTTKNTNAAKEGNGGAIYFYSDSASTSMLVENSTFETCSGYRYGGGIEFEQNSGDITVRNCSFTDCSIKNTNTYYGGGVYTETSGTVTITDCTFEDCYVNNGYGGAVCHGFSNLSSGSLILENVSINGHKSLDAGRANATNGGAVYSFGNLTIKQSGTGTSEIKNCRTSGTNGGAVNVASGKKIYFEGDVVINNNFGTGAYVAQQKNVVLEYDNNGVINTTENGLGDNAKIGVYVIGTLDPEGNWYKQHGGAGDPFGTYFNNAEGKANLDKFVNDRNGMLGTLGSGATAANIVWASGVKLHEAQEFRDFVTQYVRISHDSAFTARFTVSGESPKIKFRNHDGQTGVNLPVGTTLIMRINDSDYYYYKVESACNEIPLASFMLMGGAASQTFTPGTAPYTAQFVIDFSNVATGARLNPATVPVLNVAVLYGGASQYSSAGADEIELKDPASFAVVDATSATMTATTNVTVSNLAPDTTDPDQWYTGDTTDPDYLNKRARADIWDNRDMALVIYPDTGVVLPSDATLKVKMGSGAEQNYTPAGDGKFIIPLGTLIDYSDVRITLVSSILPPGTTTYILKADLMVSNTLREQSPQSGFKAASGTIRLSSAAPVEPSVKITSVDRVVAPELTMSFTVKTVGTTSYRLAAKIYQKGTDWGAVTLLPIDSQNEKELKAINVTVSNNSASPTSYTFAWTTPTDATPDDGNDNSFKLVVQVIDGADNVIMEVPYYFLTVAGN